MMEYMESPRRGTPLSDQNTTTTTPSSAAAATTSVTTTTTQSKPLKPYTATTRTRHTTTCSPKSNSSIGSNLPETVLESDKTHVSKTRKDKQKANPEDLLFIDRFHLRLPIGPITLRKAVNIDPLDETQFARTRKDKGKAVLRGPPIGSSYLFAASITQAPVSSASGRRTVAPGTSDETPVAKMKKDKQNVIPEDTSIERFSSDFGKVPTSVKKLGFKQHAIEEEVLKK